MEVHGIVFAYLLMINAAAFLVFGWDKLKAKRDGWRVPEKTLLTLAVIGISENTATQYIVIIATNTAAMRRSRFARRLRLR